MAKEKKKCPECGEKYINLGAHMRAHKNEDDDEKDSTNWNKLITLMGAVAILLVLGGIYFVFNLRGGGGDVGVNLGVPDNITRGVPFTLDIDINNKTSEPIKNTNLVVQLSQGLVNLNLEGDEGVVNASIGDIGSNGLTKRTIRILPTGEVGSEQTITASLSYSFGTASFEEEFSKKVEIQEGSINLSIEKPDQILSGSSFETTIKYKNNTDFDFPNLELRTNYPDSFNFLSSSLAPSGSDNVWSLGGLNAREEGTIDIRGKIQGGDESSNIEARILGGFTDTFYPIVSTSTTLKPSGSPISLDIRQMGASEPGNEITYEIEYENGSGVALQDAEVWAEISGDMFDFDSIDSEGSYDSVGNVIRWTSDDIEELSILEPGEEGEVSFKVSLKDEYPIRRLSDKNFTLNVQARIESPTVPYYIQSDRISAVAEITDKVEGKTTIEAEALYRDADSGIVNEGSLPPTTGESTEYTIHWKIRNYSNDINNVKVSATLPKNVEWTGNTKSTADSKPAYNEEGRTVTWNINQISATKGVISLPLEAIFQVEATPTSDMVDSYQTLLSKTTLTATDEFTGRERNISANKLTTRLKADPTVESEDGKVRSSN